MKKFIALVMILSLAIGLTGFASAYDTKKTSAIKATPVIDGVMDDIWASAPEVSAELVNQTLIPSESTTTGKVRFAWDEKYFYVFAVITDTAVWPTPGPAENADSVEFGMSEINAKAQNDVTPGGTETSGNFRIGTNDSEISGFGGWFDAKGAEAVGKVVINDTGYVVEYAIPWNTLKPIEGNVISLEVQINDNSLGEGRTGLVTWNSDECLGWRDSESQGEITLAAAPAPAATEAPADDTATPTAPQTGDVTVYAILLMVISAAVFVGLKKNRVR